MWEKEEKAGYHHFLHFPVFSKAFFFMVVKIQDCEVRVNSLPHIPDF